MSEKKISWILHARDSISGVLKRVGGSLKSFASTGIAYAKSFATGLGAIAAAAVAMSAKCIAAYHVQAQAEAKLTAVLKATGYAAGFTTSQLKEQASELQKQTGIGDEVILSMQGILASFRNISGQTFIDTTKAILDMSVVMQKAGQDSSTIEQAAVQVGKAMNDPVKGLSALSRVGVTFTAQQKAQIQALQDSGNLMGAQKIILDELKNEFGGAAEGIDKNKKAYDVFKCTLSDVQEEIGKAITRSTGLNNFFDKLTEKLVELINSGRITLWVEQIAGGIDVAVKAVGKAVSAFTWLKDKTDWLLKYNPAALTFNAAKGAVGLGASLAEGNGFGDALKIGIQEATGNTISNDQQLETVKARIDGEKTVTAEKEKQDMIDAKAAAAAKAEADAKAAAAQAEADAKAKAAKIEADKTAQFDKLSAGMEYRIKLQDLLNKGMETEAELLKAQQQLGRELTDDEKSRLAEKINTLRQLEAGTPSAAPVPEKSFIDRSGPETTSLEKIGAIMGGRSDDRTYRVQTEIARNTRDSLAVQKRLLEKNNESSLGQV